MTNQRSPKRKVIISSPLDSTSESSDGQSSKRQRVSYPIFKAEYDHTPQVSTDQFRTSSSPPSSAPYKQPLPFRRIPPTYPRRPNPSLRKRRRIRRARIAKAKANASASANSENPIHPSRQAVLKTNKPISTTTTKDEYSNSYEQYLEGLAKRTPRWLRDERIRPRTMRWDGVARTPTNIKTSFMSRDQYRVWRRNDVERRRREEEDWHAGRGVWIGREPQAEVREEEEEEVREEEEVGWSQQKSCAIQ